MENLKQKILFIVVSSSLLLALAYNCITDIGDSWECKDGPDDRHHSEDVDRHREESPKERNKPVDLNRHSNNRPSQQHDENAAKKAATSF